MRTRASLKREVRALRKTVESYGRTIRSLQDRLLEAALAEPEEVTP